MTDDGTSRETAPDVKTAGDSSRGREDQGAPKDVYRAVANAWAGASCACGNDRSDGPHRGGCHCDVYPALADELNREVPAILLREFAQWVVSLDDDDPESPGRQERRSVTLTRIVERARTALEAPQRPRAATEGARTTTEVDTGGKEAQRGAEGSDNQGDMEGHR